MPTKFIPIRGATSYSFGGGANVVQVANLSDTTNYSVDLGAGDDNATLGSGDDFIVGGKGSDWIQGGEGDDIIYGGLTTNFSARKLETDQLWGDWQNGTKIFGNDTIYAASGQAENTTIVTFAYGDADVLTAQVGGNDDLNGGVFARNNLYGDAAVLDYGATGGNDFFIGGNSGNNQYYGDASEMWDDRENAGGAHGQTKGGDDTITGGESAVVNALIGDAYNMNAGTLGGDDTIHGGDISATNNVYGDAVFMIGSHGGNDAIHGGNSNCTNILRGDAQTMYSGSVGGNDTIAGGTGGYTSNVLLGDAEYQDSNSLDGAIVCGDDILYAASGTLIVNELVGDIGNVFGGTITFGHDILYASSGGDRMFGDWRTSFADVPLAGAADFFVFTDGFGGVDQVLDFRFADGDKVYLIVSDVDYANAHIVLDTTTDAGSTRISYDSSGSNFVTIVGVTGLVVGTDIIIATALP